MEAKCQTCNGDGDGKGRQWREGGGERLVEGEGTGRNEEVGWGKRRED